MNAPRNVAHSAPRSGEASHAKEVAQFAADGSPLNDMAREMALRWGVGSATATPRRYAAMDLGMLRDNALQAVTLLAWINNARQVIDHVRGAADIDTDRRERLGLHDIRYRLDWDEGEESASQCIIFGHLRDTIENLYKEALDV